MGAYAYCVCGQPLERPTITEIVEEQQSCPSCRKPRGVDRLELVLLLTDLTERIETLENRCPSLPA